MAGTIIGAHAVCMVCKWNDGNQNEALARAREHNRKTGHQVVAETTTYFEYNKLKEETK